MARILVAGGSLGGLFVANMLLRDGHDVRVIEKVKGSMNGRGAGIVSHDALVNALERLDLDVQSTLGVLVPGRVLLDGSGNALQKLDMPQVLTSWSRLYQILLDQPRVHEHELHLEGHAHHHLSGGCPVRSHAAPENANHAHDFFHQGMRWLHTVPQLHYVRLG
jgi:2-polyprenyl-6-methoxyphenol hydroxylase-like FAD-dependent oxidoreductase